MSARLLPLCCLSALLAQEPPVAPSTSASGPLRYELPRGWTAAPGRAGWTWLLPEGASSEADALRGSLVIESALRSLQTPELRPTLEKLVAEMLPDLAWRGEPSASELAGRPALLARFQSAEGAQPVRAAIVHALAMPRGVAVLLFAGDASALAEREPETKALLASLQVVRTAERIAGGVEQRWQTVAFDLPKGWKTRAGDDRALLLLPPGFTGAGEITELYALVGDGSVKALGGAKARRALQAVLDEVQPGLRAKGEEEPRDCGELEGRLQRFAGKSADGRAVSAEGHSFLAPHGACALMALGFPAQLEKRRADLEKILGSLRAEKASAQAPGDAAKELVGRWQYFSSVSLSDGGRATDTMLLLREDGTYLYTSETSSSNPLGGSVSNTRDEGRWSVSGARVTFRSVDGGSKTYALEKRNHPKTGDPMIVLDGQAFVTYFQRAPWRGR
ncbi:MAG: hypothetical protein JNM84_18520 [Planctomycetes bacterium]|nr:hypothetical protein [Planctomycetota bacterium]